MVTSGSEQTSVLQDDCPRHRWGTVSGTMLPFTLRSAGMDPASTSAPLVATVVDVTGIVIYFTVVRAVLGGVGG
jgi:Mg/Co/Ni transporter MgtE